MNTLTFKSYLLLEGGKATAKYNVERANKQDIEKAIDLVSTALGLEKSTIKANLLGSTETTLIGKKKDSGDVDIAMSTDDIDPIEADKRMMKLCNNEGYMNKGTRIGSYAVNVGNKKVQVDLMFVNDKSWAKFIYHSAQGNGSNYPGAVRNIMLMTAVRYKQEPGKDLLIKDGEQVVLRATRALKLDVGLERLFKMANKSTKSGQWSKTMNKVQPEYLQQVANNLVGKPVKFSHQPDIISSPDKVAEFIFGKGVKAKDLMTAEQVAKRIHKLPNAEEVIKAAKDSLVEANLPIPKEL